MEDVRSLNHIKWECKYHVVWIPKYRKKTLYVELRRHLGSTFRDLAMQKECQVTEGHLLSDHIHMPILMRQETEDRRLDQPGMFGQQPEKSLKKEEHSRGTKMSIDPRGVKRYKNTR